MKKIVSRLFLIAFIFSVAVVPYTTAIAHDADGIYYVPSVVKDGKRDYRDIQLYYKQDGVEDKTDIKIDKPTSCMVVSVNNQTGTDGRTLTATVGQPITIDFSQSSPSGGIADIGLQITNGTGDYTNCWSSLPGGSGGTAYGSTYPFSWGAASFTPDKAGTYTIYGEVRADIDKSEIFEHWDAWSANGSRTIVDTIQAHTSYPAGPIQSYNVTWHFEQVTVIVTAENLPPVAIITAPDTCYVDDNVNISGDQSYDTDGTIQAYTWNTTGATGSISAVSGTVKYNTEGVYTIKLTVTDDDGATGNTTKLITVIKPDTQMGTLHVRHVEEQPDGTLKDLIPPFDITVPLGTQLTLEGDGTFTITYPNGTISTVKAKDIPGYNFNHSEMSSSPR